MSLINVMQVTDTLETGGAERVALNLANLLPRDRYGSWLCTTRRDGPLSSLVGPHVKRVALNRRTRFDVAPLRRLARDITTNRIDVVHAHGTSLFVGLVASLMPPRPAVIWHIHHLHQRDEYAPWLYRVAAARAAAVIAVSEQVADWATRRLRLPPDQVVYLPNFSLPPAVGSSAPLVPGRKGCRIISVANLRPEKDQLTLVAAFALLRRSARDAHLLLVGGGKDEYRRAVQAEIDRLGVADNVSLLGERTDVAELLAECDIAVLSSATEGFPLSLIEYGQAGLPVVATRVGQCPEVLDDGSAGLLVDPHDATQLSGALLSLWHSRAQRRLLGKKLSNRVHERYSAAQALTRLSALYDRITATRSTADAA